MRRGIPKSLLALVTVLAIAAAGASIHTAERVSYFSTPEAGNPTVVKIFRTVVQRMLNEPSFTVDNFIDYQAPHRFRVHFTLPSPLDVIEVGHEIYIPVDPTLAPPRWGRSRITSAVDQYFGPDRALGILRTLLTSDSVARDGSDNFIVKSVMEANSVDPRDPGQVLATFTVYVDNDLISSVVPHLYGWITIPRSSVSHGKNIVKGCECRGIAHRQPLSPTSLRWPPSRHRASPKRCPWCCAMAASATRSKREGRAFVSRRDRWAAFAQVFTSHRRTHRTAV